MECALHRVQHQRPGAVLGELDDALQSQQPVAQGGVKKIEEGKNGSARQRPVDGEGHRSDAAIMSAGRIAAVSLAVDRPLPRAAVFTFLDLLDATLGDRRVRLEGSRRAHEDGTRPLGLTRCSAPSIRRSGCLPSQNYRGTRLVLIAIDAAEDYLRRLIACGQPTGGRHARPCRDCGRPAAIAGLGSLPRRVTR